MPSDALKIEVIKPGDGDPQLDMKHFEYKKDLASTNLLAGNCFLIKMRETERGIILKVLLGPRGHKSLNNHYDLKGFPLSGGGGMLWTTPQSEEQESQLCIGSYSYLFYSAPEQVLELIKEPIAAVLRDAGAKFREIVICPTGETNPSWEREPFKSLLQKK